MFDTYSMVTVYHHKTGTLVQHLIDGGFERAKQLHKYICGEVYNYNLKHLTSTLTVIANNEIRCHIGGHDDCISHKRNINNDVYLIHAYDSYDSYAKAYTVHIGYTNTFGAHKNDAIGTIYASEELSKLKHIVNRISCRGVELIDDDGREKRLTYIRTSYSADEDIEYVNDELTVMRI